MDDRLCVLHNRKGDDYYLGGRLESIESINRQVHPFCYCHADRGEQHKRYGPPCSVKCSCVQIMFLLMCTILYYEKAFEIVNSSAP